MNWYWITGFLLLCSLSAYSESPQSTRPAETDIKIAIENQADATSAFDLVITTKRGIEYPFPSPEIADQAGFLELDEPNQERFLSNRLLVLRGATAVLNKLALPLGFWKTKVTNRFRKKENQLPKELSARDAGQQSVREMLQNLDKELWAHAPVISQAHEFGGSIEVGVSGGAQVGRWGLFGLTGLGLTFAVDPTNKVFVVELYQDFEKARRVDPFYLGAGVFLSFLGSGTYHNWKEPLAPEVGHGVCLPGLAACITRNNFRAGISEELGLGFPSFAAFNGKLARVPILRIGVSPKWVGFVRAKSFVLPLLKLMGKTALNAGKSVCGFAYRGLSSLKGEKKL